MAKRLQLEKCGAIPACDVDKMIKTICDRLLPLMMTMTMSMSMLMMKR